MDSKNLPKDLLQLITKAAPMLGSAFGGPAGTLIGSLIANAFGADPKKPEDIIKKIMSDPEYEFKLQKLEQDHEENLKKISNERYATSVEDRKSARDYNAKMNDAVVHVIAIGYSGLFAIIFTLMAFKLIAIDNSLFMNIFSIVMIILNYYFGSSHKNDGKK